MADEKQDLRPLTGEQWAVMFAGPEWDQATLDALTYSLPKAFDIHSARLGTTDTLKTRMEAGKGGN